MITNKLIPVLKDIENHVSGDFVEFGIFRGNFTYAILPFVMYMKRKYWGFDSFEGMAEPTKKDVTPDGKSPYPKGRLKSDSYTTIMKNLSELGYIKNRDFTLVKGFIPQSLNGINISEIAFAYIDLDQYQPTLDAFDYVLSRMSSGSYILFDDYFAGRDYLAAGAISKIINRYSDNLEIVGEGYFFKSAPTNQICVKIIKPF